MLLGYPGKVTATVTYQLTEDNSIIINFTANTQGKATPINLTNHAYFNLAGHVCRSVVNYTKFAQLSNFLAVTVTELCVN